MSETFNRKPLAFALGATFAAAMSVGPVANADSNPFGMQDLGSGYMQLAEGKCGEGKTEMEGKCGGKTKKEGKCGDGKTKMEGNNGEGKNKKEGKCGEAKCGGKT
jgi:uncharacterized low-complexity protein